MKEASIGQRELARELGQTFAYMYKILSGQRTVEFTELVDIAEAIGLDPSALVAEACRRRGADDL
jgi:transcriptional regulator with XRE-family HTH domain